MALILYILKKWHHSQRIFKNWVCRIYECLETVMVLALVKLRPQLALACRTWILPAYLGHPLLLGDSDYITTFYLPRAPSIVMTWDICFLILSINFWGKVPGDEAGLSDSQFFLHSYNKGPTGKASWSPVWLIWEIGTTPEWPSKMKFLCPLSICILFI